eukprot:14102562-Ditylum_brightwellii.AAC.1
MEKEKENKEKSSMKRRRKTTPPNAPKRIMPDQSYNAHHHDLNSDVKSHYNVIIKDIGGEWFLENLKNTPVKKPPVPIEAELQN